MVEGMSVVVNVMLSQMSVMNCCDVMYFRGELGFLNCNDIGMCVVNKQFQLLEFVFEPVYLDLQYDDISLTLLLCLCACGVFVVLW